MARIIVQTDSGTTLLDERHVSSVRLDSETEAVNLLERMAWAIEEADRRRARQRLRTPVLSGFGRTFD